MKKLFYILNVLCVVHACQTSDENEPAPAESFIKYYGEAATHEAKDIEILYNADDSSVVEGFILFGSQQLEDATQDYYVLKTDAYGNVLKKSAFGFKGTLDIDGDELPDDFDNDGRPNTLFADEIPGQLVKVGNRFVVAGTSVIGNASIGISRFAFISFAVFDEELNEISFETIFERKRPGNGFADLYCNDVIALPDETVLLVGSKQMASDDKNFYYTKYSLDDDAVVYTQESGFRGTGQNDVIVRAFALKGSENVVLIGHSNNPGTNGETGVNVAYLEINSNGNVVKSSYNGIRNLSNTALVYDDEVKGVIQKSGGYAVVGTSGIAGDKKYAFFMSLDEYGRVVSSDTITSAFGFGVESHGYGLTRTIDNDFILVGQYPNFQNKEESRNGEAMIITLDQSGVPVTGRGLETNYGLMGGNDVATDVVTLPDGAIAVTATADFGGGISLIALIKLNNKGKLYK